MPPSVDLSRLSVNHSPKLTVYGSDATTRAGPVLESLAIMPIRQSRTERFRAFVKTHRTSALRLTWQLLGTQNAHAEDIVQQAFMKAWDHLPRFRDDSTLKTWFNRILVNLVRSHQRWYTVRRRAAALVGYHFDRPQLGPDGDHALQKRLATALDTLSVGQREAFVLVHLQDLTVNEAAEATGRAPGTVKSHLHRALTKLRVELTDIWEERR